MSSTCGTGLQHQPCGTGLQPVERPALMARILELEQQVAALRDQLRRHSQTIHEQQVYISHQWSRLVEIRNLAATGLALPGADA